MICYAPYTEQLPSGHGLGCYRRRTASNRVKQNCKIIVNLLFSGLKVCKLHFLIFAGDEILQDDIEAETDDSKRKDGQSENDIPDLPNLDEKNMDIDSILSDGKCRENHK